YAKANQIKVALGSASKNARLILERTAILPFFDAVIDGNSVAESKPHPEVFTKAAIALHTQPEACVVFEDAQAGVDAAKAAGMDVVGIGSENDLHGANLVVGRLVDVKM